MPSWIPGLIEVLKPLMKFLGFLVDFIKKPLVTKEQERIEENQQGKEDFERNGRPK